jgi:hypothetical protein
MRTWKRAELQILCGLCHRGIYREQPKVRCRECAGEAVPAELPSLPIKPVRQGLPFARFSAGMLPLDFKSKAANE